MLKISARVSAISLLPLLGLVGFAGLSIVEKIGVMSEASRLQEETALAIAVGDVVHEMQAERGLTAAYFGANGANASALQTQQGHVDEKIAILRQLLGAEGREWSGEIGEAISGFEAALETRVELRDAVMSRSIVSGEATIRFTDAIGAGMKIIALVSRDAGVIDAAAGRALASYATLGRAKEYSGRERAIGVNTLSAPVITPVALTRLASLTGAQDAEFAVLARVLLQQDEEGWRRLQNSSEFTRVVDLRERLNAAAGGAAPFAGQDWFEAATARIDAIRALQLEIAHEVDAMAGDVKADALGALVMLSMLALLTVLGALAAAFFVGRSITKPLAALTGDMNALAAGDKSIVCEAAERTDELGEMGRAVLVFKNAAIEIDHAAERQAMVVSALGVALGHLATGDLGVRIKEMFPEDYAKLRGDFNVALEKLESSLRAADAERARTEAEQKLVVEALALGLKDLALGDLAVRIKEAFPDDYAKLREDFNRAIAELERAMQEAAEERRRNEAERAAKAAEQERVVVGLASGLKDLSDGNLTSRLSSAFAPEYEQLRADFNTAMEKLQSAMRTVVGNAGGIRSGAGEISQAADDLSKRTEQQAASLEETAAALDEITATVRKTAEGANLANGVVTGARADAEASGQVVRDAVAAMGEIEKSSNQISQIIGVIDEIAFQTNLLALNAGVEAARAGEAGRGFAVVASEVRALAQRSSEAAKEIKGLISASSDQVETGVHLVGEAGQALQKIVSKVSEINALVGEIAASAQEQATGLAQVNTAVNQMDQVTQQNAAMVEETTAASHSLTQEAQELMRLISRFRTGEDAEQGGRVVAVGKREPDPAQGKQNVAAQRKRVAAFATSQGAAVAARADWEEF